jgi:hypothetical protein
MRILIVQKKMLNTTNLIAESSDSEDSGISEIEGNDVDS